MADRSDQAPMELVIKPTKMVAAGTKTGSTNASNGAAVNPYPMPNDACMTDAIKTIKHISPIANIEGR